MGYGKTYKTKWLEDLSGNQGTANQVLISTSAGIAWATASTVIGGPYLPLSGGTMTGNTTHGDNVKSLYGTGGDLEIYHDGSNSYIKDVGTGFLNISSDVLLSLSNSANELYFLAVSNGEVKLYHNNSQKFQTTAVGVGVTGDIAMNNNNTGIQIKDNGGALRDIIKFASNNQIQIGSVCNRGKYKIFKYWKLYI